MSATILILTYVNFRLSAVTILCLLFYATSVSIIVLSVSTIYYNVNYRIAISRHVSRRRCYG